VADEEQTSTVKVTSVSGAKLPHVKQYAEVDGITIQVGEEADLTEDQVSRLKSAGVNFGTSKHDGGES
jgi:hypothetical protein